MARFLWKAWLRPNKLTPDLTDFIAEVDTAGSTRRQQDIINRIMEEGSEVKAETIKAILDRANVVKQQFILDGYSVFDELVHLTPRITGTWTGKETFTKGKHRLTVDAFLSKTMHEELHHVGVEVLGVADSGARIMLVTDVATGKTDGTVTMGDDIVIAGDKIKVAGLPQPDGSMEPGMGVFFVEDGSTQEADRISENQPSRVVARTPYFMGTREMKLRIVTRYGGSNLLKTPRVIEYDLILTLKASGNAPQPTVPGGEDSPQQ
ncbi:MAG: DUF4469 domain-containing protein [Tannerellaceae bacterium]|jgi:hypothetical protein|nr:DUF4469 domain-containing protein [Tannerellaceae bacterium]